tara:strand:+ start:131 stop:436 length:306 start_codon:yes stop_codon:yes gene_type:complete
MDRNRFNREVRHQLTEIPIGKQGIAFDRLEMDAWIEDYVACNGRRPKASKLEDELCQNVAKCRVSASKGVSGTLRKGVRKQKAVGSVKARAHLAALKRKQS